MFISLSKGPLSIQSSRNRACPCSYSTKQRKLHNASFNLFSIYVCTKLIVWEKIFRLNFLKRNGDSITHVIWFNIGRISLSIFRYVSDIYPLCVIRNHETFVRYALEICLITVYIFLEAKRAAWYMQKRLSRRSAIDDNILWKIVRSIRPRFENPGHPGKNRTKNRTCHISIDLSFFSSPVQGYDRTKLARDQTFHTFEEALKFLHHILKS